MSLADTYLTIARPAAAEIKEKASRFIAEAFPVSTADAAEAQIAAIRKREYNATHVCSAWRVGPEAQEFRSNDDGEPSGSAGAPILRHIEGRDLTNIVVTVTRYYGGTKLGTGGLIRAYGGAAELALEAAGLRRVVRREPVTLSFDYDDTSPAMHVISLFDATIGDTRYDERTHITVHVRLGDVSGLRDAFVEALSGRGEMG